MTHAKSNFNTGTQVRTGGGCKPKGINEPKFDYAKLHAAYEIERLKRVQAHAAWLLSDEGVAWQMAEGARITSEEERQRLEAEESAKRAAWAVEVGHIKASKPSVGAVVSIIGAGDANLFLKKDSGKYFAWCLLRCSDTQYPDLPVWHLAGSRRFGLKLFFDWPSCQELLALDPDTKDAVDRFEQAKIDDARRYQAMSEEQKIESVYNRSFDSEEIRDDSGERSLTARVPSVKILSYSESGKSGRCSLKIG